jgi:hypothetical protein
VEQPRQDSRGEHYPIPDGTFIKTINQAGVDVIHLHTTLEQNLMHEPMTAPALLRHSAALSALKHIADQVLVTALTVQCQHMQMHVRE